MAGAELALVPYFACGARQGERGLLGRLQREQEQAAAAAAAAAAVAKEVAAGQEAEREEGERPQQATEQSAREWKRVLLRVVRRHRKRRAKEERAARRRERRKQRRRCLMAGGDVSGLVMQFLDAPALAQVAQVCRDWRLLAGEEELWRNLCRTQFGVDVRNVERRHRGRRVHVAHGGICAGPVLDLWGIKQKMAPEREADSHAGCGEHKSCERLATSAATDGEAVGKPSALADVNAKDVYIALADMYRTVASDAFRASPQPSTIRTVLPAI